jgi:hypothetical protein
MTLYTGRVSTPDSLHADDSAARRRHFGHFYGLLPLEAPDERPFVVVHGNCQAGSIRRLLETAGAIAVRIPPVHQLTEEDAPLLHRLVRRADALVSQPIADDYHGLPVGSAQLAALLPPSAQTVLFPVLRFAGLFPFQVTVRPAFAPSVDPPGVPYHDLRTLLVASACPEESAWSPRLDALLTDLTAEVDDDAVRRLALSSVDAMRIREERHGTLTVSDVLAEDIGRYRTHHTLNHPTNAFLERIVVRIITALRWTPSAPAAAPEFEMLGGIRARVEPVAARVFPVESAEWSVGGTEVADSEIRSLQFAWYRKNPGFVPAGLERHADTLELLGLRPEARL